MKRRRVFDVLEPTVPQEIAAAFGQKFDIIKGIAVFAQPLFAHDERLVALQARDLPVDVEHLRLEESGAITGDDRARSHGFFKSGLGLRRGVRLKSEAPRFPGG